jgi:hypothetical protein
MASQRVHLRDHWVIEGYGHTLGKLS